MKFTKILAILLAAMMLFSLVACGTTKDDADDKSDETKKEETTSDLAYVTEKGKLVVGITNFAPMDYQEDGEWIGFDADLATLFAEEIGVEVEFVEIEWSSKVAELDGKTIDCVWNGMTLTDEVKAAMECSNAYCNNQQMVIVPVDKADQYKTAEDCKDLKFAVEDGSAGEDVLVELGYTYTAVLDQATALMEVKSGTSEAAVIDSLMAMATVGEGTDYADLTYTVGLNEEKYGVGFRKGSDLAEKLNEFFVEVYEDGTMAELAEEYKILESALIEQK